MTIAGVRRENLFVAQPNTNRIAVIDTGTGPGEALALWRDRFSQAAFSMAAIPTTWPQAPTDFTSSARLNADYRGLRCSDRKDSQ